MKKMKWISGVAAVVLLSVFAVTIACAPKAAEPAKPVAVPPSVVKVGVPWSFTGRYAPAAEHAIGGAKLAEKEINDAGGFKVGDKTYIFEMVYKDDRGETGVAGAIATELAKDYGVKFMMGSYATPAVSVNEVCRANGIMHITGSSAVVVNLGKPGYELTFSWDTGPPRKMAAMADVVKKATPNVKKVVWVMPEDTTAVAVVDNFKKRGTEIGITTDSILFPPGTTNVDPFITRAKLLNPDMIGIGMTAAVSGILIKSVIELNAAPVVGGYYSPYDWLTQALGTDVDRPYLSLGEAINLQKPTTDGEKEVLNSYVKFLGKASSAEIPNSSGLYSFYFGYPYIYVWKEAMQVAGTVTDPVAVAKAMRSGREFKTKLFTIHYDQDNRTYGIPIAGELYEKGKVIKKEVVLPP